MDEGRFDEGRQAYEAKDYRTAVKAFIAAADRGEGSGAAYHMAGNALVRLRRFGDAVTVYQHALADPTYDKHSAVNVNLGMAYVSLGDYAKAVTAYQAAIDDHDYTGTYRALQGKAGALCEIGDVEQAALAYRQAALDQENPDPGKSLNNLGLCFMAMHRPGDAAEAYRAALGFDTYAARGKTLANLGQAFHVLGRHTDAVKAFEKAIEMYGHQLSEPAAAALAASREALSPDRRETVEGWATGEMPHVVHEPIIAPPEEINGTGEFAPVAPGAVKIGDQDEVSAFFSMTDEEMRERDRETRRAQREDRRSGRSPWAVAGAILLVIALVAAALGAAYAAGMGYPTQRMTVSGMLEARAQGSPVARYWVAVPTADIDREMAKLPPMSDFVLNEIDRSRQTSRVTVTITPESGAPLLYEVTLVREGLGWKVTGVENDWRSTGGGS